MTLPILNIDIFLFRSGRVIHSGPRWETRTPGLMVPNVCLNLQLALYRPLWRFPLLRQVLFDTLLPCLFQGKLSPFGIGVGLDSVY